MDGQQKAPLRGGAGESFMTDEKFWKISKKWIEFGTKALSISLLPFVPLPVIAMIYVVMTKFDGVEILLAPAVISASIFASYFIFFLRYIFVCLLENITKRDNEQKV